MLTVSIKGSDERQFKALTGLSKAEYQKLLPIFEESYYEIRQEKYEQSKSKRQRKPGGGQKGKLDSMSLKLFFILYYLKTYPTFDVLGFVFGLDRSRSCTNVHALTPVLQRALSKLGVLPKRAFESVEEMKAAFESIEDLFIDVTEREQVRPKNNEEQRKKYSGKKKRHTVKNTVISTACKMVLFLGYTVAGSIHDYRLLKEEFPPEQSWFATFKLWVDLGYLGIKKDYEGLEINIPHKKPNKSKANPAPDLTAEQKAENRQISRVRIVVENAISGMKRFNILTSKFRNRKENFVDDVAAITAGLWNWKLFLKSL